MKKRTTKILSVILAVFMLCTVVSMTASAEEPFTEGYYTYTVTDGEATITDVDASISGDITVPSTLGGYPVTIIGEWAFPICNGLTSVNIPESVKTIEKGAFFNCRELNILVFPKNIEIVKDNSFSLSASYDIVFMNPDCVIDNSPLTGGGFTEPRIVGFKGSTAEVYAQAHDLDFKEYCEHSHQIKSDASKATCTQAAFTAGTFCNDCNEWFEGHIITEKAVGHKDSDNNERCDVCKIDFCEPKFTAAISEDENYYYVSIILENAVGMELATFTSYTNEEELLEWDDWLEEGQSKIPEIPEGIAFFGGDKIPGEWSFYYGGGVLLPKEKYEQAGYKFDSSKFQFAGYKIDKKQAKYDKEYSIALTATITIEGTEYILKSPTFMINYSKFYDSDTAKISGDTLVLTSGVTMKQLLNQADKGAVIKDNKGNVLSADKLPGTGMKFVLPDGKEYTIVVFGDSDGDGKISASDARLALRASVGLEDFKESSAQYKAANVSSADKLSAADARLILRASVGLEDPKSWMK